MTVILGLKLAFDRGNLTDYFASRLLHVRIFLIATKLANIRESLASFASAFTAKTPAMAYAA